METCGFCGEALAVVEGKYSGTFIVVGDGVKVHGAFHDEQSSVPDACVETCAASAGRQSCDCNSSWLCFFHRFALYDPAKVPLHSFSGEPFLFFYFFWPCEPAPL